MLGLFRPIKPATRHLQPRLETTAAFHDHCIDHHLYVFFLLSVRGSRPGKQVQLAEHEIRFLCQKAREIFMSQPILLELEAPIKICGE